MSLAAMFWLAVFVTVIDAQVVPYNVTDASGNLADNASVIHWAPLPAGLPYNTSLSYNDGGLGVLFDMARGFVNVVQPNPFPYDIIQEVAKNFPASITNGYMKIIMYALGFAICLVIGLLFVLLMPLIGCCFCCCRLCGNCGGRRYQKPSHHAKTKKIVFIVALFCITAIIAAGAACMFVSNERMTTALNSYSKSLSNDLGDVIGFIHNAIGGITFLAKNNFAFTGDVISRDLDNIGMLVGVPVRDDLASSGINTVLANILQFQQTVDNVQRNLTNVNSSVSQLKSQASTLQSNLSDVRTLITAAKNDTGCSATCTGITENALQMDVNFNNLPNITSQLNLINNVKSSDFTQNAKKKKVPTATLR